MAQTSLSAWQEEAQDQLIRRPDTVVISWPDDILSISMGMTKDGFEPNAFAHDVVCQTLLEAGKPMNISVLIEIYSLKFDGAEWGTELIATRTCE